MWFLMFLLQVAVYGFGVWLLTQVNPSLQLSVWWGAALAGLWLWMGEQVLIRFVTFVGGLVNWLTLGLLNRLLTLTLRLLVIIGLCLFLPTLTFQWHPLLVAWQAIAALWIYCAVASFVLKKD